MSLVQCRSSLTMLLCVLYVAVLCMMCMAQTQVNVCVDKNTCGECIAAGELCGWCNHPTFNRSDQFRCDLLTELGPKGCDNTSIINPQHYTDPRKNHTVQNAEDGEDAVQLQPQELAIKLRPNKPYELNVMFRQAENYPVDLYYVMDLSYSMNDDKNNLASLGVQIVENMQQITKNVRLGFGSFVDKKTMPFVSTVPKHLEEPCTGCVAPYSFHNQLPLTDHTAAFEERVQAAPISGNLDGPEGGFDAIMQAIACNNEIGWREKSRKMLLFSTDADFHYAGDGKLGGIVDPNDGHCHLDGAGHYSESLNQDYPSISQLSSKIAEKKVNVIFAVTKEQVGVYEQLMEYIEGSVVGELAADSSNVVELVEDNYNKISSNVELKTSGAEGVNVRFQSECLDGVMKERSSCDGLSIGGNVTFKVTIEVTECPEDPADWIKTFDIYPVGLTEKLKITLNLTCECECEASEREEPNSPHCNGHGTYECGACTCNEGRYGKNCECDGSTLDSDDYNASCKKTNTSIECENKGTCVCGRCECNPISPTDLTRRYSGQFCECNNYNCDRFNKQFCGGPERGQCVCGTCQCNSAYNGTACQCPISQDSCRAKDGSICNGLGVCNCGKCECTLDTYYRPPTCEDCPTCPGKCEKNKACVQCVAFKSGELSEEDCMANCTHVTVVDQVNDGPDKKMCRFQDDDDCMFYFTYDYNHPEVEAQRTKECPQPVNILAIVLGVIGGILAVGILLLLIWKLLDTIHYRRECAQFKKELENAKWDASENPIFKNATTSYPNPTYAAS